ncbi:ethylene receptor 2 [Cajanus cajan]|uniref:ethylene receptor 2 n=1 Tax=Cajanus cajan TaxID=3821 RepID=UPI00098DD148|nr:ethylene receptor 2 [Cajanus cajan]XP_020226565.1 ethylene receptor 2 [Cajanus cajan]XP_029129345.1 ethylene receptor 2 [Cajanus cajan]
MLKAVSFEVLLIWLLLLTCVFAAERCNCDDESSLWTIDAIVESQRVGDFLIAVAYFSIPIELLFFVSCSSVPFKWVLFQFIAFIVLCGMTHLLNGWTYGPHTFQLMVAVTVFKILTALVSCATSITLLTLIPMLLKVKVRELMLKKKTFDLGREFGIIMRQKEATTHVRMLTQEIRKSLDKHKILYTTLVELSEALGLQNCAVWMPNIEKTEVILTHELNGRNGNCSLPITDADVVRIKGSNEVIIIDSDSVLATASCGASGEAGPVAAIRMPMLRFCNFKGGTPELRQTCYAILVLILPCNDLRSWSFQELEIIKVVADQVAVALSHAAIIEESQLMRDKLLEQNLALQAEKTNAMMASQARAKFQKVMSDGMRRPMHSILMLLSMLQSENLENEQKLIVDSMLKTSNVLSNLINDAMDHSPMDDGRFNMEMKPFGLHAMIKEAACLAKFMSVYRSFGFVADVDKSLPDNVVGDEKRVFQVILHMIGNAINGNHGGGVLVFRVFAETGNQGRDDQGWNTWRPSSSSGDVNIRFEIGINAGDPESVSSVPLGQFVGAKPSGDWIGGRLNFNICKRIIQLMQGNIWLVPNAQGFPQVMALFLRFQLRQSFAVAISEPGENSEPSNSNSFFRGLQVLLVDNIDIHRAVTQRLLHKLGCVVTTVSSGYECLNVIGHGGSSFQVILLDLHMPELDGFEVATRIRKFGSRNWPMILGLTSSSIEDLKERCVQIGINGLIRKPVLLHGIASELRRILMQGDGVM